MAVSEVGLRRSLRSSSFSPAWVIQKTSAEKPSMWSSSFWKASSGMTTGNCMGWWPLSSSFSSSIW
jgi:hypothetical protein